MKAMNYIKKVFQDEYSGEDEKMRRHYKDKLIAWRKAPVMERVERPTNIPAARAKGYKAKKGIIIVRIRIRRSSGMHERVRMGRRPKRMGSRKIKRRKSIQWIAEERVSKKYPGLEVLNSYWVGEDGQHKYYEVILVNPKEPGIKKDKDLKWITEKSQQKRVLRAKTASAKKAKRKTKSGGGRKQRKK